MNLLTVVNALNEARDDADAGLLELVLELRGDMLVYGYWCGKASNTKTITIKEIEKSRFVYDVISDKCLEMAKEMMARNINTKEQKVNNEKEGLDADFASQSVEGFNYKLPAIRITERYGRKEIELEFATAEDYAAYKRIEAEAAMTDKQKYDAAVNKSCEQVQKAIKAMEGVFNPILPPKPNWP